MLLNCGVGEDSWESLGLQELQPVRPKRNQSWIFIGRTDAEAETPIIWPPDVENWLVWKDPYAGKDWRREEEGTTEDEMVGWHHWLNEHEFAQALGFGDTRESLVCCSLWCRRVEHDWVIWDWKRNQFIIYSVIEKKVKLKTNSWLVYQIDLIQFNSLCEVPYLISVF